MHEYWDPTDEKLIDKRSYLVKNVSSTSSTVLATSRHYSAQAQEVRDKTVVFSRSVEEVAMWWRELFWLLCERGIDGLGCTRTKLLEELSRAEAAYDQLLSQHSLYHRALLHSLGHASSLRLLRNDIDTIKAHALGVASAPDLTPTLTPAPTSPEGCIFAFGGARLGKVSTAVLRLDLADPSRRWECVAEVAAGRCPKAVVVDGAIFVMGDRLRRFNPLDNSALDLGPAPVEIRYCMGLVAVDNKVFAVNRFGPSPAFDLATKAWQQGALPSLRATLDPDHRSSCVFFFGGEVWLIAVRPNVGVVAFACRPGAAEWRQTVPLCDAAANGVFAWQPSRSRVLFVCTARDEKEGTTTARCTAFYPASGDVHKLPSLPTPTAAAATVAVQDAVFLLAHASDYAQSARVAVLDPESGTVADASSLPFPTGDLGVVHWTRSAADAKTPSMPTLSVDSARVKIGQLSTALEDERNRSSMLERKLEQLERENGRLTKELKQQALDSITCTFKPDDDLNQLQQRALQYLGALTIERARRDAALAKQKDCAVCFEARANCSFQCGHVFCSGCAQKIQQCPSCREPIKTRTRLFL